MAKKVQFTTNQPSATTDYLAADNTWKTIPGGGSGIPKGTTSGTDTYTTTISGVSAYNDGDAYLIRFANGNTTGCTLNINSLGAKDLYRNNNGLLIGGDIVDGAEMFCIYNTSLNGFQVIGTAPNTLLAYVTNADSVTITKGQPVYAFGGTGDRLTVKLAYNTTDATSAQTVGLVLSSSIAANQKGLIIVNGQLDGLSILPTSTYADGDAIYLGATAGTITNVKPSAPNHLVYLGFVTTANNGSAGRMYVRVQNGYELQELHNVKITSVANDDILKYNSSNSLWENSNALSTKQDTITGAASTVVSSNLTPSRVVVSNGGGKLDVAVTTTTEIGYVSGVTSNIQTQLNAKLGSSTFFLNNVLQQAFVGVATRYHSVAGTIGTSTTTFQIPLPTACNFSNFYFRIAAAQGATGTLVLTLQKNGVDSALTITIAAGSAAGNYTDNTNTVTFAAGDTWQLKIVNNATTSTSMAGYSFKVSGI